MLGRAQSAGRKIDGRRRAGVWLIAMLAGIAPATAQQPPAAVHVDAVIEEPLAQTTPVVGRLVTRQSGSVAALVAGAVDDVYVDVGDRVAEGTLMAQIDTSRLLAELELRQAQVEEGAAALEAARASEELANQELARLQGLRASAAFSQARYDDAVQEVARVVGLRAEAEAALARYQSSATLAGIDYDDATVRAPYAGVVTDRHVSRGEYVTVGATMFTMINDTELEVEAAVPSNRVAGMTPGTEVTFRLDDGSEHRATVRAALPDENSLTRTRTVRLTPTFADSNKPLAENQSVVVFVPIGEARSVVTVHKDAVIPGAMGDSVFVVEDGVATPRPVMLGEAAGIRFAVLSGLAPGELVVVRGNERLRPGQPVTFGQPEGPPQAAPPQPADDEQESG